MPENNANQTEDNEASQNATSDKQFNERSEQPLQENNQDKNIAGTNQGKFTSQSTNDIHSDNLNASGTAHTGATGRKSFGDVELNKGLESQAKDEESKHG